MLTDKEVKTYFGKYDEGFHPYEVFNKDVCEFLEELSARIRKDKEARTYSDIQTFAFFIRKTNIGVIKKEFEERNRGIYRYGRGIAFHVAPSNIPINFAFSWVYGLLSGNSNIVKASSKDFDQTRIICRLAKEVIDNYESLSWIEKTNVIITYDREKENVTKEILDISDARIIWGGDSTIQTLRQFATKPRSVEISFADRYSFAVIDSEIILGMNNEELKSIAHRFYNDTYLVDQNACSSPHMIFWIGKDKEEAENRFWSALFAKKSDYDLSDIKVSDKYVDACLALNQNEIESVKRYDNFVYVYKINKPPKRIVDMRGRFGAFFSCYIDDLNDIAGSLDDEKIQTCLVLGIDKGKIISLIYENGLKGIDRIVEVGNALNLGVIWDGYDVLSDLSRCICLG